MRINLQVLILVLILLFIFSAVFFGYINAQDTAKDQKRLSDIKQIQAALKIYFDENGFYPASANGAPKDIETYISFWPQPPSANGKCSAETNKYVYSQRPGLDYSVSFCLGKAQDGLAAGEHRATSKGIE